MADLVLTSPGNPRLKALAGLRRRRAREEAGVTLVEGLEELSLAVDAGAVPQGLFRCRDLAPDPVAQDRLVERVRSLGAEVVEVSVSAFGRVAYREGPDGVLAVVPAVGGSLAELELELERQLELELERQLEPEPELEPELEPEREPDREPERHRSHRGRGAAPLVLICERVEKPGNLGAVLRTADAAGVSAVIAADPVTDWGNPNVVRASKGTVFAVPVATTTTAELVRWLAARGIPLVATTPDTDTWHTEVDYRGPVAVAVGAEKAGLSAELLAAAHARVRIPMSGRADSLNVATSAAIVLYEAVRQRLSGSAPMR